MSDINKLIAHWSRTKGKRKHKLFDLGNDETLDVWWSPWTLGQMDRVFEGVSPGLQLSPTQAARVVAVKAENKDGKRLFADIEEMELLNECDPVLVMKIALTIHTGFDLDNQAAIADPVPGEPVETSAPKA